MRIARLPLLICASSLIATRVPAQVAELPVGISVTLPTASQTCPDESLIIHHDDSFENGFAWTYMGVSPPYVGSFAESYQLGAGTVDCVSLWHAQIGYYTGQPTDVFVWEGGVSGEPGVVLGVVTGVVWDTIPVWPEVGRFDVPITVSISDEATVGSWGDWSLAINGYFWLADSDGPEGHPWTYIAFGQGYPGGWQNPEVVFGDRINSLGIGVHFTADEPVPTRVSTWGSVKTLYR